MMIREVSPNTLDGSFSKDLILSKIWLINELAKLRSDYGTIYVLGSWFGNLGLLMVSKQLSFDQIINVDEDETSMAVSNKLVDHLGLQGKIKHLNGDANLLRYSMLGDNGLVVNTSCNNIEGNDWFERIPKGTMVALQGRDRDPGSPNRYDNIDEFVNSYDLSSTDYHGKLRLEDPETSYDRYMLIGTR